MKSQLATLIEQGDLRFIYQHRLVTGAPDSGTAAEAVECAGEQGKFWPFHDKLFTNQRLPSGFTKNNLNVFAKDLGLNTEAFSSCLDSRKHSAKVTRQDADAIRLGVKATPTFSLNGKMIEGLPSGDGLLKLVQDAVNKAAK